VLRVRFYFWGIFYCVDDEWKTRERLELIRSHKKLAEMIFRVKKHDFNDFHRMVVADVLSSFEVF
jgi:hypothetical protein